MKIRQSNGSDQALIGVTMISKLLSQGYQLFVCSAACFAVAACSGGDLEEPEIVRPAKLYVVKAPDEQFDTSFPAIIEAGQSSTLTFQVSGLLESLPIREGLAVRKGTPLARLDQRRYRNAVASAKAQYDTAQSEYLSAQRLLEEDAIARISVDQRRAQRDVAKANFDSAQKDLTDTVLRAPFSGLIAERHATQFENVQAGQDIVTLQSIGTVEAVVSVPASLVPRLAQRENLGTNNNDDITNYVVLNSAPDVRIPGVFRSATTQADAQSQTFQVKFAFTPPRDLIVLPGMTGTVFGSRALLDGELGVGETTVPLGAVLSDGKSRYVWVVDRKTMTVKKRKVAVSEDVGADIVVESGLKAGETIVAAGAAYLHDGMKIRPYTK